MNKLSYKIMLDRYAQKDLTKQSMQFGSIVIATVDETNPRYPQKEVCTVLGMSESTKMVYLKNMFTDETYNVHIDKIQVPTETEPEQIWKRIAKGCASVEQNKEYWEEQFYELLKDWNFVPGGRIMAMCGSSNEKNLTAFNCFVIPSPKDSRGGAIDTLNTMVEIMSRGGGVGINLSTLRPRNAIVRGVNGTSSGAVSWGAGYSFYTGLIEQGGSRRGALLLGLAVWHPDIEEFITVKQTEGKIENANLSVLVTEDFMRAVEMGLDWDLEFPDTTFQQYETAWDGDLKTWKSMGYPTIVYKTVKAVDLWNMIVESAWRSAEPGVVWIERYNMLSNSWYFEPIVCVNPCGEEGLPAWGVCNLGHINLANIELDPNDKLGINRINLSRKVRLAVRFLDNIIDITPYFFTQNEEEQKTTRRIGLGTMGLAELLIKLKIRYGSRESLIFADSLYSLITNIAYDESVELAKEKGSFPLYSNQFLKSEFVKTLSKDVQLKIRKYGIRNVALLTQAPTGSTGTMVGTSTGIEPFYAFVTERKGRLGTEIEKVKVYQEWAETVKQGTKEPDYFVTAMDLTPEEHIRMMAVIQKHIDASISKTVNLPNDTTVEEVARLYKLAYDLGCKGITLYRDGSRETQVLTKVNDKKETDIKDKPKTLKSVEWNDEVFHHTSEGTLVSISREDHAKLHGLKRKKVPGQLKRGEMAPVPEDAIYTKVKIPTGCGTIRFLIGHYNGKVVDVYTVSNGDGGCAMGIQGHAISISRFLRLGGDIYELLEDSMKAGICNSYMYQRGKGRKDLIGKSCFNAMVRTVAEFQEKLDANSVANNDYAEFIDRNGKTYLHVRKNGKTEDYLYDGKTFTPIKSIASDPLKAEDAEAPGCTGDCADCSMCEHDTTNLVEFVSNEVVKDKNLKCPSCGGKLIFETGCLQCKSCGYSKCE